MVFLIAETIDEAKRIGGILGQLRWDADMCSDSGPDDGDWVVDVCGVTVTLTTFGDARLA